MSDGSARVTIRPATAADHPSIADIHVLSWQTAYRGILPDAQLDGSIPAALRAVWDAAPSADDLLLVAEVDRRGAAELAGFLAIRCGPDALIDNLHVRPEHRARGVGGALIGAGARELRRRGVRAAHLWVFAGNDRAARLYRRLGGVATETRDKDIFGTPVPSVRLQWSDLSELEPRAAADAQPGPGS